MNGYCSDVVSAFRAEGRLRSLPQECAGVYLDFSSNDYMGIAANAELTRKFIAGLSPAAKFTSSASRLLSMEQKEHVALESWLERVYGKSALLFNSGYHANVGCVSALAAPGTVIVADKLVHASIIDGLKLSGASFRRFKHNDLVSLHRELDKAYAEAERVIVIVESIYSMDGDEAPLCEIVALKREFPHMLLYVDEAHALGVRGLHGLGVCEETGVLSDVDIIIGTFGKAVGSTGAFVATSSELKEYLLNTARSFIFSTALPPVNVAYTHYVLKQLYNMQDERRYLAELSNRFRHGLELLTGNSCVSHSQIVPLMAGSNERAVTLSAKLRESRILALPIRCPTVAAGTERLRFSLSTAMNVSDIDMTLDKLASVLKSVS